MLIPHFALTASNNAETRKQVKLQQKVIYWTKCESTYSESLEGTLCWLWFWGNEKSSEQGDFFLCCRLSRKMEDHRTEDRKSWMQLRANRWNYRWAGDRVPGICTWRTTAKIEPTQWKHMSEKRAWQCTTGGYTGRERRNELIFNLQQCKWLDCMISRWALNCMCGWSACQIQPLRSAPDKHNHIHRGRNRQWTNIYMR